jgi:hypothetical protein
VRQIHIHASALAGYRLTAGGLQRAPTLNLAGVRGASRHDHLCATAPLSLHTERGAPFSTGGRPAAAAVRGPPAGQCVAGGAARGRVGGRAGRGAGRGARGHGGAGGAACRVQGRPGGCGLAGAQPGGARGERGQAGAGAGWEPVASGGSRPGATMPTKACYVKCLCRAPTPLNAALANPHSLSSRRHPCACSGCDPPR